MLVRRLMAAGAAAAVLCAGSPAPALTQAADSSGGAPLFEKRDLYWAAGFAAATAAVAPLDRQLARTLQDEAVQANRILSTSSAGARLLGSPGAAVLGGAVYGAGRLTGNRGTARAGLHAAEAVIIADLVTGSIKVIAGRKRPYASLDNPYDFRLMRGLRNDSTRSFPSGHTTSAFAAAAVVTAEASYYWESGTALVGPVLFGVATIAGVSRMYHNAHWASDVVVGAAIGTFVGWKVARYTHDHPTNAADNFFLGRPKDDDGEGTAAQSRSRARPRPQSRTLFGNGIPITFSIPAP
jgi:membrane-associated phospholipid phosphatase